MLKVKNYQEAFVGLLITIFINYLKNHFSNKTNNIRILIISGIGWAIHFILRKYIMNYLKNNNKSNNI